MPHSLQSNLRESVGSYLHLSACAVLDPYRSVYFKYFYAFFFTVNFLLFSVIPEEVYTWPDIQSCRLPHDDTKDI